MSRSYKHIQEYEKEIMELRSKGKTGREICERLGISKKQYENFITRYNKKHQNKEAGISLKRKGRPRKDRNELPPSIQQLSKLTQLQYDLASKDRYIKRLEMENELMRDFLSLTERK
jgi:transcriptional regulator with XRE-family HTH domain